MDIKQLKKAINRLADATEKAYEKNEGKTIIGQLIKVNEARWDIETAICKLADILDEDVIFN